jgi:hypothetical protein
MKRILLVAIALTTIASAQTTTPPPPPLTLWGVTIGQPLPALPSCHFDDPNVDLAKTEPCLWRSENHNLPYEHETLNVYVDNNRVVEMNAHIEPYACEDVCLALEKKLGKPADHKVRTVENSFGATWNTESWLGRPALQHRVSNTLVVYRK